MKKPKNKILSVFFIAVFISCISLSSAYAQQKEIRELETIETTSKVTPGEVIVRPRVDYDSEALKDPFMAPGAQIPVEEEAAAVENLPLPTLTVQGVIWGAKIPQAIINNTVVKTGDTIEGARILSIDKEGVTIFFQGRQVKIPAPSMGAPVSEKP
jgi:hypothetical protein